MIKTPLITRPSIVALGGGGLVYALLYWLSTSGAVTFSHWWFHSSNPGDLRAQIADSPVSILLVGLVFALYLVPGFVAGLLSRRSGLMHGLIIGALLPFIQVLFLFREFLAVPSLVIDALLPTLFLGLLFSSIAGIAGETTAIWIWHR